VSPAPSPFIAALALDTASVAIAAASLLTPAAFIAASSTTGAAAVAAADSPSLASWDAHSDGHCGKCRHRGCWTWTTLCRSVDSS